MIRAKLRFRAYQDIESENFSVCIFAQRNGDNDRYDACIVLRRKMALIVGDAVDLPIEIDMSAFLSGSFHFGVIVKCEEKIPIHIFSSRRVFSISKEPPREIDFDWIENTIYEPRMLNTKFGATILAARFTDSLQNA